MQTMEGSLRHRALGEESLQMWELNKRLESYLSRVKFLEQENELLKVEIQELQQNEAKTSWKGEYEQELRALRGSLDEIYRDKSQAELERERLYDEFQLVRDRWEKEKQAQETVKERLKESKKEMEEERRAQNWLKEKALQLETELQFLQEGHEEEMLKLQQEIAKMSRSFTDLRVAPASPFPMVEVEEYSRQLSEIWKGAIASYRQEISQVEASLQDAKEQLHSISSEKKETHLLLQNLQRELDGLRVRKEMLEQQVTKQQLEQQDCRLALQSEIDSLEEEKEKLRQQIVQVLQDRQQLMELKMSLSIEVATYRTLLEAESVRLQPYMEYSPASLVRDIKLDNKSSKLHSLSNNVADARRKFGSMENRINLTSVQRGINVTPQLQKLQPELLKTTLINRFQGTSSSFNKSLQKDSVLRLEPAAYKSGSSVAQKATSKKESSPLNSTKTCVITATVAETISESFSCDSAKPLGFQPTTHESKLSEPSDKTDYGKEQRHSSLEERTDTKVEVETKEDELASSQDRNNEGNTLNAAEIQPSTQTMLDTCYSDQLITEALEEAFETLKGADEDASESATPTFPAKNVDFCLVKENELTNDDSSCQRDAIEDELTPQSLEHLGKAKSYDGWENREDESREDESTAELSGTNKEAEIVQCDQDDQHISLVTSIEPDRLDPNSVMTDRTHGLEDKMDGSISLHIETKGSRTLQVMDDSTVVINQEVTLATLSECENIKNATLSAQGHEKDPVISTADEGWQSKPELGKQLETLEKDTDSFNGNHVDSSHMRDDEEEVEVVKHMVESFSNKLVSEDSKIDEIESYLKESSVSNLVSAAHENGFFGPDEQAAEEMKVSSDSVMTNGKEYDIYSGEMQAVERNIDHPDMLMHHKQNMEETFTNNEGIRNGNIESKLEETQHGDDSQESEMKKEECAAEDRIEKTGKGDSISEGPVSEDTKKENSVDLVEQREESSNILLHSCDLEQNEAAHVVYAEDYFAVEHITESSKSTEEVNTTVQPNQDHIFEGHIDVDSMVAETDLNNGTKHFEDMSTEKTNRNLNEVFDNAYQQEENMDGTDIVSYHEDELGHETMLMESSENTGLALKDHEVCRESVTAEYDESALVTKVLGAAAEEEEEEEEKEEEEERIEISEEKVFEQTLAETTPLHSYEDDVGDGFATEGLIEHTADGSSEEVTMPTKIETGVMPSSTEKIREEISLVTEELNQLSGSAPHEMSPLTEGEKQSTEVQSSVETISINVEKDYLSTAPEQEIHFLDDDREDEEEETSENNYLEEQVTPSEPKEDPAQCINVEDTVEAMEWNPPSDNVTDNYMAPLMVNKHDNLSADSDDDFVSITENRHEEEQDETNVLVHDPGENADGFSKSSGDVLNEISHMHSKELDKEATTYNTAILKQDHITRNEDEDSQEALIMPNEDTANDILLEGCLGNAKQETWAASLDNDSESTEDDESPNASKAYQMSKHHEEGSEAITTSYERNQSYGEQNASDYPVEDTPEHITEENRIKDALHETETRADKNLQLGSDKELQLGSGTLKSPNTSEEQHSEETVFSDQPVDLDSDRCIEMVTEDTYSLDLHDLSERNVSEKLSPPQQVEDLTTHGIEIITEDQPSTEQNLKVLAQETPQLSVTLNGLHMEEKTDEPDFINESQNEKPLEGGELPTLTKLRSSDDTEGGMLDDYGKDAFQGGDSMSKGFYEGPVDHLSQQDMTSESPLQVCLDAFDGNETSSVGKNHSAGQQAQEDTLYLEDFMLSGKDKKESSETAAII